MSPDDVFAAQFWPWPDPAIKRDAQGRVMFVNAAFLALYGGRVEDWRGNAVGGWPAPQPAVQGQVTPFRFETRLPDGLGSEQVYDWMEQTLADGNAFALARNVTLFTTPPDPEPGYAAQPDPGYAQNDAPAQHAPAADAPVAQTAQVQHAPAAQAPAAQAPAVQAQQEQASYEQPAAQHAPAIPPAQQAPAVPEIAIPEIEIPADTDYDLSVPPAAAADAAPQFDATPPAYEVPAQETHAEPAPAAEAPAASAPAASAPAQAPQAQAPQNQAPEREREFERRALPIEPESAVLGNNWRDAVIAKAVGAADVADSPAAIVQAAETEADNLHAESGGAIRILLAEDNAINALLTRTLLEAEGHTVETVEDGALAVEAMKTSRYDLIFMDMRMPNMDGLEATRKIRALPNVSRHLPIIALTANAFDDDRNACFDSGMNDFMTKPVSAEELSEMVGNWTGEDARARMENQAA